MCGGELGVMGTLGNLEHLRCRNCGAEFHHNITAPLQLQISRNKLELIKQEELDNEAVEVG